MESIWFLQYGSGLVWLIFNYGSNYSILIGASGAIYGILLAYGLMFPNRKVLIYFLFPIRVKYFVAILALISFVSSIDTSGSNISHLTHLSGMIIGFVYLKFPSFKYRSSIMINNKIVESKQRKIEKRKLTLFSCRKS